MMSDDKLDRLWRDKRNWKLFYAVYHCKQDPRIIVPKINRSGRPIKWLGTTWNLAHLGAYPTIVLFAALGIGPAAYMVYSGVGGWVVLVVLLVSLYVALELAWYCATRVR